MRHSKNRYCCTWDSLWGVLFFYCSSGWSTVFHNGMRLFNQSNCARVGMWVHAQSVIKVLLNHVNAKYLSNDAVFARVSWFVANFGTRTMAQFNRWHRSIEFFFFYAFVVVGCGNIPRIHPEILRFREHLFWKEILALDVKWNKIKKIRPTTKTW